VKVSIFLILDRRPSSGGEGWVLPVYHPGVLAFRVVLGLLVVVIPRPQRRRFDFGFFGVLSIVYHIIKVDGDMPYLSLRRAT